MQVDSIHTFEYFFQIESLVQLCIQNR